MIPFDLEKALAGEKVVTKDGREVTQFSSFDLEKNSNMFSFAAVVDGKSLLRFNQYGVSELVIDSSNLFMATKKLSGFVNVYKTHVCDINFGTKKSADEHHTRNRIACIDLSQFEEGHGLD